MSTVRTFKGYRIIGYDDEVLKRYSTQMKMALDKCTELILTDVRALAPFDYGKTRTGWHLRDSYRAEKNYENRDDFSVIIGTNFFLGKFYEFGTMVTSKVPHLYPAVEKNMAALENIMRDAINYA